jgi:hypothetical protein
VSSTVAIQTNTFTPISTQVINGRIRSSWQFRLTFPKGTPAASHQLSIRVDDAAGNREIDRLAQNPLASNSFNITNSAPNTNLDVTQFDLGVQLKSLQDEVATLTSDKAGLASQVATLTAQVATFSVKPTADPAAQLVVLNLQSQNRKLSAQLKRICSAKPRPKGC